MVQPPFDGDILVGKRELIKLGVEQGYVTLAQIAAHLPVDHLSDSEREMLAFTFESMGIEVLESPPADGGRRVDLGGGPEDDEDD